MEATESTKNKMEEMTVSALCKKMGPAQLVTLCEEPGRDGTAEVLFSGKAAALRRQFTGLIEHEVKHITTYEDDAAILRGSARDPERQRRGIVIYVYSK